MWPHSVPAGHTDFSETLVYSRAEIWQYPMDKIFGFFPQLFIFFCLTPWCFLPHAVFFEGLYSAYLLHQSRYTYTYIFISAYNIAQTYEEIYLCCRQKQHRSCTDFQTTLSLTVLLTRTLLQCLPNKAGACCTSITFGRRENPALTKRNKYRMLMAGNVHRAENNIFDKILSMVCLSWALVGCDTYCCPSQTWVMELSFLLQFLMNVTAIKYLLTE